MDERRWGAAANDFDDRMAVRIASGRERDARFGEQPADRVQVDRRQHADVAQGTIEITVGPVRGGEEPGETVSGR